MSLQHEGIGPHAMWGYTPAQDLLRDLPLKGEANILICKPGDVGHVLRTIGTRRRHPQHTINLYVWESEIEVLARHLLLLKVAQDWELPIRQRANVFLEIFGNCLVQDRTGRYISRLGKELVNTLFSTETTTDTVDLSLLKCRERDRLEEVFKSWDCDVPCNMTTLRDARLRNFFGSRYDHRKNLVDWDYTNRLKNVASIIHYTQYRSWRLGGIAYEFGDQKYDQPNRTMISYAEGMMVKGKYRGTRKEMRGFWLDIRIGPFITFGVDCERPNAYAEELFTVINKSTGTEQHRHNTAEVAVFSMLSYLWGLETREQYAMTKRNDIYSGLGDDSSTSRDLQGIPEHRNMQKDFCEAEETGAQEGFVRRSSALDADELRKPPGDLKLSVNTSSTCVEKPVCEDERTRATRQKQAIERAQCIVDTFTGVKVFMLSGDLNRHLSKPCFRHLLDRVHMSPMAVDMASSASINEALADQAIITMDTGRYVIPFNKEQQRRFVARTCTMASENGWKRIPGPEQPSSDSAPAASEAELNSDSIGFSFTRMPDFA